jgi:hypothetical protein
VKDQANASQNGIWVVGSFAPPKAWARADDSNTNALVTPEMVVRVSEGNSNAHTEWTLVTQGAITLGTTGLTYARTEPLELPYQGATTSATGFEVNCQGSGAAAVVGNWTGTGVPPGIIAAAGTGVVGTAFGNGQGVAGSSPSGAGVVGSSASGTGVDALSNSGAGLRAKGSPAGLFQGNVEVTGKFQCDGDALCNGTLTATRDANISGNLTVSGSIQPLPPCFAAVSSQPSNLVVPSLSRLGVVWLLAFAGANKQKISNIYAATLEAPFSDTQNITTGGEAFWTGEIVELSLQDLSTVALIATVTTQPQGLGGIQSKQLVKIWQGPPHAFAAAGNLLVILWSVVSSGPPLPSATTFVF